MAKKKSKAARLVDKFSASDIEAELQRRRAAGAAAKVVRHGPARAVNGGRRGR